jgi:putative membrane protein
MSNYLSTLPHFALILAAGFVLLALFWSLYTFATPHDELALIRAGNVSAAIMLAGAMLGFALPVGVAMAKSQDLMELAQWGSVALLVQFAAYVALRLMHRGLHQAIEQNQVSVALWAATMSVCAGIVNAGAQLA